MTSMLIFVNLEDFQGCCPFLNNSNLTPVGLSDPQVGSNKILGIKPTHPATLQK